MSPRAASSPPATDLGAAEQSGALDNVGAGQKVVQGGMVRVGGYALGALATVAASAIVIRQLGPVDTGRFVTVMTLVAIAASVSDLGLTTVGLREYSIRDEADSHRFLRNLLGMRVALALAGIAGAIAFAVVAGYDKVMVEGAAIAGIAMVLFAVQQNLTIPMQVGLRFGWVTALLLLFQWGVAATAALLAAAGAGLVPFFAVQIPVVILLIPLTVIVGGRQAKASPIVEVAEWRKMLLQIVPYSAAVLLAALYFRLAQILVSLLTTGAETGYFGVSYRVLEALTMVPPLLVSTALPLLSRMAHQNDARFISAGRRVAEIMLVAGAGVSLTLFLGAEFVIDLVAGPGFDQSVGILQVLAIALTGTFLAAARGYVLVSLGQMRSMLGANLGAVIVVIVTAIPLIQARGAMGAAIALVWAELALTLGYEIALSYRRPSLRLPLLTLARVGAAVAIAVLPAIIFDLPSLLSAAAGLAIYLCALLLLGGIPVGLRQIFWSERVRAPGGKTD